MTAWHFSASIPISGTGLADHNARKVILYRKVGADAVALQNNAAGIYLSIPLIGAVGISIPSRCFPTNLAVSVRIPSCRLPGYAPLDSCLPVSIQHAFSTHNTSIFLFHCSPGLSRRMLQKSENIQEATNTTAATIPILRIKNPSVSLIYGGISNFIPEIFYA